MNEPARILHLFANYKWTGPADPAIRCAVHLRRLDLDVVFAQAEWTLPKAEHRLALELAKARMPAVGGLELRKHFRLFSVQRDRKTLGRRLRRGDFDVLHSHLLADHLIAALARRRARRAGRRVVLVRSLYDAELPRRTWRTRLAFRETDGVIVPRQAQAAEFCARFALPPERVLYLEPPAERHRLGLTGNLRQRLGLAADHIAIGITARIQPHRRFELLWESARRLVAVHPQVRFVLLGRGNAKDTQDLVREPVARLGLAGHVLLPGYLYEPEYSLALRALDAFVFLVPGSNGTCRAVREAMVLGLPVVATGRGMLPDLLAPVPEYGIEAPAGTIVAETPEAIASALARLVVDPELRARQGGAAAAKARLVMDPEVHAACVAAFYEFLRENPR